MGAIIEIFGQREEVSQILIAGILIIFRVLPVVFVTPFLGGRLVPPTTKMGISFVFAIVLFPHATAGITGAMHLNPVVFIVLMLKELFVGFVMAFVATEMFYAMEIGGRVLDVMRGSNMAEVQVPELQFRASPLGGFLFQCLLMAFLAVGGHRIFILALADSFALVPIDGWPAVSVGFASMVDAIVRYTSGLFTIAFALVFPGLFATFMTDVVFGMLNRVAPQLNAYFMAMGVKAMSAIALLFFALGIVWDRLTELVTIDLRFVQDVVRMFG